MKTFLLSFLSFVTLLSTTGSASAQQFYRQLSVDGDSRRYLIYLPVNFDESENMPVMMWFHGGGGSAAGGPFEADFRTLADANRFIVVYAEAAPDVLEGCTCWGYDSGDGEANGNYEIDLAYSSAMIDDLVAEYNADRSRMYAGGYSMGASFVWDLAKAKSDEFAAIAPVAASMYLWSFNDADSALPTAVCHILGTNDFYAPYNGASWVPSVATQNAYWVAKNGAQDPPEQTSIGNGVTRYTWAPGDSCHGYQHFRRQGGGHDVPSFAPSAIWDFVSQYDLDGVIDCGGESIPGDLNGDDQVNGADLGLFLTRWGTNDSDADTNGNGSVEGADLGILLLNWTI
jgi:polyhydroxybutyrate depolymerase